MLIWHRPARPPAETAPDTIPPLDLDSHFRWQAAFYVLLAICTGLLIWGLCRG